MRFAGILESINIMHWHRFITDYRMHFISILESIKLINI